MCVCKVFLFFSTVDYFKKTWVVGRNAHGLLRKLWIICDGEDASGIFAYT